MEKITWTNFKKNLIAQPYFVWHGVQSVFPIVENEKFWAQDIDFADSSQAQVMMETFYKLDQALKKKLLKNGAISISGTRDEKIKKTQQYINSNKVVIGAIFEYQGAIAAPFAFDFKNHVAIDLKYSKKTKRMDFMKAYYHISIIDKTIIVKDYRLWLPPDLDGKKHQIDLIATNAINISKSGDVVGKINLRKNEAKDIPVMQLMEKGVSNFTLKNIDIYLKEIEDARNANKIRELWAYDVTDFGFNPYWDFLLKKLKNPYAGYNGKVINKKMIAENKKISNVVFDKLQKIKKATILDQKVVDKLMNSIDQEQRIIWYDFEGFSLPYPALDYTKANQQIVFQVSIIETIKNIEQKPINAIFDPFLINVDDLYRIIELVYANKADKYIVYNRGYENSRLKEMVNILAKVHDRRLVHAQSMYKHIEENTIDLMVLFAINSNRKLPPILLPDQKGNYSIKNIEKHISKNAINVNYQIKEYKNLYIKNGAMAMQMAIERATGVMKANRWNEVTNSLKIYCENDVRAMIMVYFFIKYLHK